MLASFGNNYFDREEKMFADGRPFDSENVRAQYDNAVRNEIRNLKLNQTLMLKKNLIELLKFNSYFFFVDDHA